MNIIDGIYKINYMKNRFNYVGTLRNQYKFEINEIVFFAYRQNEIAKGKIVGVQLPPTDNPDYLYKIQLPEELIQKEMEYSEEFYEATDFTHIELRCERIFRTAQEAKDSAIQHLENMYELQKGQIKVYFKSFIEDETK